MGTPHILIIEDDPNVATLTRDLLLKSGYQAETRSTGQEGLACLEAEPFDLLVLDLGLPDVEGLDICKRVREDPSQKDLPIFILTARGSSEDIVLGLEAGAEDYLPKPFNEREFVARVQAILRRRTAPAARNDFLSSGNIRLSPSSHEVWCLETPVPLTLREFDILRIFLSNPGKAMAREELIKLAWGPTTAIVPKVVDVHVGHLRTKLGSEGKRIETVPQVGYKLLNPKK